MLLEVEAGTQVFGGVGGDRFDRQAEDAALGDLLGRDALLVVAAAIAAAPEFAAPEFAAPIDAILAVEEPAAGLAAEAGIAVFRIGFERWTAGGCKDDLAPLIRDSLDQLRAVTAGG